MKKLNYFYVLVFLCSCVVGCEDTSPVPEPIPEPEPTPECVADEDCPEHRVSCYTGFCVEEKCEYEPDDSKCGEGYECRSSFGCMPEYPETEPNCEVNEDCDDGVGCTLNECLGGRCFTEAKNSLCPVGFRCDYFLDCVFDDGSTAPCLYDTDCDDGVGCTRDICSLHYQRCFNFPSDDACPDGYVCDAANGCVDIFPY